MDIEQCNRGLACIAEHAHAFQSVYERFGWVLTVAEIVIFVAIIAFGIVETWLHTLYNAEHNPTGLEFIVTAVFIIFYICLAFAALFFFNNIREHWTA